MFLESSEFIRTDRNPDGLVPEGTYKSLQQRGKINVIGRGGNGREILIKYESLPPVYKTLVQERFGNPYEYAAKQPIRDLIVPDEKAREFFDNLDYLNDTDKAKYANDAAILNAFNKLLSNKRDLKRSLNITIAAFWTKACEIVKDVAYQFPNTLPTSERRLKPHYNNYVNSGFDYATLIDGRKFNETNNKIVDEKLEWLIMSLFVQSHRPYKNEIYDQYLQFLAGKVTIIDKKSIDKETGEIKNIFDPADYQKYGELSATTIWRILTKPVNMAIVDKLRLNALDYSNKHLPFNERKAPQYSLSKISIDDKEMTFRLHDNDDDKKRVSAYEIFDVTSGCCIGKAFGLKKNRELFLAAIKDMFRFLANNNLGIPAEIEFEHHIANTFLDDLLQAGNVFPFTRLCRAANPREKRAEHNFRPMRYSQTNKNTQGFIGRPFARSEANRMNERSTKKYFYDEIVAIELANIDNRNNELHHKQDLYPNMTRMEVFMENLNPNLAKLNHKTLARYIGEPTTTTIRNNKILRVQHQNYWLPSAHSIALFDNYSVTAYYIPQADGSIPEVHVYQNDEYKCTCALAEKYNEAQAEQTDTDVEIMHRQFGYRSSFDAQVKESVAALAKVEVIKNDAMLQAENRKPKAEMPQQVQFNETPPARVKRDYRKMAEEDV